MRLNKTGIYVSPRQEVLVYNWKSIATDGEMTTAVKHLKQLIVTVVNCIPIARMNKRDSS